MSIPCYVEYKNYGGTLSADKYQTYSRKAWNFIDYYTRGKATTDEAAEDPKVKECVFELVEIYSEIDSIKAQMDAGAPESESIGSYSVHFAGRTQEDIAAAETRTTDTARHYLWEYCYRGVRYVC
jgi:hypothetical protein